MTENMVEIKQAEVYSAGDPQSPDYESCIWVPVKEA